MVAADYLGGDLLGLLVNRIAIILLHSLIGAFLQNHFLITENPYSMNTNVRPSIRMSVGLSVCLSGYGGNVIFLASN